MFHFIRKIIMSNNSKLNTLLEGQKVILAAIAAIPAPTPSNLDTEVLEAHLTKIEAEIGSDDEPQTGTISGNDTVAAEPAADTVTGA